MNYRAIAALVAGSQRSTPYGPEAPTIPDEEVITTLLGVGSTSTSLVDYPKTATYTTGDIWVDPNAGTNGSGSQVSPYNNLGSALSAVADGQRIIVREGTLAPSTRYNRGTNWATGIEIFAYGAERFTIDCVNLGTGTASRAISMTGSNEHWKGFEVKNAKAGSQAVYIEGSNNKIEDVWVHHCLGDGIYIANWGSGGTSNIIQDFAIWRLGDGVSVDTNVPDGIVATGNTGSPALSNVFVRGFVANGPDDNIDLYRSRGARLIDIASYGAGYYWNGVAGGVSSGDGRGYKMGGGDNDAGNNYAIGCLAIGARSDGFSHNEAANTSGTDPNIVFAFITSVNNGGYGLDLGGDNVNHKNVGRDAILLGNGNTTYVGPNAAAFRVSTTDPSFADTVNNDYSLNVGSNGIDAGIEGGISNSVATQPTSGTATNRGASTIALEIAKEWLARDLESFTYVPGTTPPPPSGDTQVLTYTEDTSTDFANPERGWMSERAFISSMFPDDGNSGNAIRSTYNQEVTVEFLYVDLISYIGTDTIAASKLSEVASSLATARADGKKVVIRFAYEREDWNHTPALARVLLHIEQVAAVLTTYQDVIMLVQTGMFGPWGEQWYDLDKTNGNNWWDTASSRRAFFNKWFDSTPTSMMLGFRYARDMMDFADTYFTQQTLPYIFRYNGTDQARLGLWSDSINANYTWGDTWRESGTYNAAQERAYNAAQSAYTPLGGEGSDVGGLNSENDASTVIPLFADMHIDYHQTNFWPDIFQKWQTSGDIAEISRRLGYRLALTSVTMPTTVTAGASMSASLTFKNAGFGKVFNARPMDLVFVGPSGPFTARMTSDARKDLPTGGATATTSYTFNAPAGLLSGQTYNLYLRLPDRTAVLASNNDYAIRLANTGIWDGTTGRNSLGMSVLA